MPKRNPAIITSTCSISTQFGVKRTVDLVNSDEMSGVVLEWLRRDEMRPIYCGVQISWRRGFFRYLFDHLYLFTPALLDVRYPNNSMDLLDFGDVALRRYR